MHPLSPLCVDQRLALSSASACAITSINPVAVLTSHDSRVDTFPSIILSSRNHKTWPTASHRTPGLISLKKIQKPEDPRLHLNLITAENCGEHLISAIKDHQLDLALNLMELPFFYEIPPETVGQILITVLNLEYEIEEMLGACHTQFKKHLNLQMENYERLFQKVVEHPNFNKLDRVSIAEKMVKSETQSPIKLSTHFFSHEIEPANFPKFLGKLFFESVKNDKFPCYHSLMESTPQIQLVGAAKEAQTLAIDQHRDDLHVFFLGLEGKGRKAETQSKMVAALICALDHKHDTLFTKLADYITGHCHDRMEEVFIKAMTMHRLQAFNKLLDYFSVLKMTCKVNVLIAALKLPDHQSHYVENLWNRSDLNPATLPKEEKTRLQQAINEAQSKK